MLGSISQLFNNDLARGDAARDRKDWSSAAAAYEIVLRSDPQNPSIWVQYGHAVKEMGRLGDAEAAYRRSLAIDSGVADTYLQLGHVLKIRGELAEARSAYGKAARLDPENTNARRELAALADAMISHDATDELFDLVMDHPSHSSRDGRLVFDCSDLIQYFRDNRLSTGIQRVQINIVNNVASDLATRIIHFDIGASIWREISRLDFQRLVNSAQRLDTVSEYAWQGIRDQIIQTGTEFNFANQDTLINLGTSWWIPDYFLAIRGLKAQHGINYIPFIHDCIPLIAPEHCSSGLAVEFENWLQGVFAHSDFYLVNSESTSNDLKRMAQRAGFAIPEPKVVRLDGDTRTGGHFATSHHAEAQLKSLFAREQMPPNPRFVLMVSTLESRKNHLLALRAWQKMILEFGLDATPYLLCVGKSGWRFEDVENYLAIKPELGRRVRFVSNLNDGVLAELYRRCVCTFYPSHYEGWGLPVTEGLCYGKVGVVASNSSLPEAGGSFCDYFETDYLKDAYEKLVRIISDDDYRFEREQKIKEEFRAREWSVLADEVVEAARLLRKSDGAPQTTTGIPVLRPGTIYALQQRNLIAGHSRKSSGEDLRLGAGWHKCEDWGAWTKERHATLCMRGPATAMHDCVLYLSVRGHTEHKQELVLFLPELERKASFNIDGVGDHYLALNLGSVPANLEFISVLLSTKDLFDLGNVTEGRDQRHVGIGLIWLMLCESTDTQARLEMIEMMYFDHPKLGKVSA